MKVALLGCGTVGAEVARLMHEQAADLTARVGEPLEIVSVAVRRLGRDRGDLGLDPSLFTTDALGLVKRDDVDIVVKDEFLPADLRPGDLLAVPGTGAYCRSMASNYNHVPRPPVIAVADGRARVVLRRETEDDLLALDVG